MSNGLCHYSGVILANFDHLWHIVLVYLFLLGAVLVCCGSAYFTEGSLSTLFNKDTLLPFPDFVQSSLACAFFALLLYWMCDHAASSVLFCLMKLWTYTCQNLGSVVPAPRCSVLCNRASNLLKVWHWWWHGGFSSTDSKSYKEKDKHTGHASTNKLTHTCKYILTTKQLLAHNSYLYYTEQLTNTKVYFTEAINVFSFQ